MSDNYKSPGKDDNKTLWTLRMTFLEIYRIDINNKRFPKEIRREMLKKFNDLGKESYQGMYSPEKSNAGIQGSAACFPKNIAIQIAGKVHDLFLKLAEDFKNKKAKFKENFEEELNSLKKQHEEQKKLEEKIKKQQEDLEKNRKDFDDQHDFMDGLM